MLKKNKWKTKWFIKSDASKLHLRLQEILQNGKFKNIEAYQEVNLSEITDTKNNLFLDWFIPDLNLAIELHGIQHYKAISFHKEGKLEKDLKFIESKNRDSIKKYLLENAGYLFIEISFKDYAIMSEEYLISRIIEVRNDRKS